MKFVSITFAAVAITCLCFSHAEAPQQLFDRLLGDSSLIVGESGAWMVQEPRVIHAGYTKDMIFGPGKNEVVVSARDRVAGPAEMFSNPQKASALATAGDKLFVVNLLTGARRQLALPRSDLQVSNLIWKSSRIFEASLSLADQNDVILIDSVTGAYASLPDDGSFTSVDSDISHLALSVIVEERNGAEKTFLEFIDFSVSPPSRKRIEAPAVAAQAIHLTKDQTLICQTSPYEAIELKLSDFTSRPWTGDRLTLLRSVSDSSWTDSVQQPRKLEAIIRDGSEGGLWIEESSPPVAVAALGARIEQRPPALKPNTRISKDADLAVMNNAGTRVMFRALGVVFLADVVEVDKEAATQSMLAAARTKALSWARQAGWANLAYSADNNGLLPISASQVQEALLPYMPDGSILKDVVWTNLYGQSLASLKDPSTFELGYLPGLGGRAIIFADGSVKWRPNS